MCGLLFIVLMALVSNRIAESSAAASGVIHPKSRQLLPPIDGFIPVYIRPGNTPLEDINLDLAEAFESYAKKQARKQQFEDAKRIESANDNENNSILEDEADSKATPSVINIGEFLKEKALQSRHQSQHIQKIKAKAA